jgi:hypothetical protein
MGNNRRISTNDVFKLYAKKGAKLTLRKLDRTMILIEGDRTALEFLGNLLFACARSKEHSVEFSPTGAGKNRFSRRSTLGVYIHRVPCPDKTHAR